MSLFQRGLAFAAVGLGLLGVAGCSEDNEAKAKLTSAPPKPGEAAPPRTSEEYAKRAAGQTKSAYGGGAGYPGAKR